jgi:hypothetical protein
MKPFILPYLLPVITVCISASAYAEIEHSGFLGGPFHGVSRNVSGAIVNRVGPLADLAETVSLTAGSSRSKITDGESSQLQAALRLDDGTITKLLPQDVQWSSESASLLIADGFATADQVSENARVAVLATADGFSATLFIRLVPGQSSEDAVVVGELPLSLASAVNSNMPGWKNSNWFGSFYTVGNNWIHHAQQGWLYAAGGDATSAWLWSPKQEWLWTGPGIYPHLFRSSDATWIYFMAPALPRKIYYNHTTEGFEEEK